MLSITIRAISYLIRLPLTSLNFLLAGLKIASLGLTYAVDEECASTPLHTIADCVDEFVEVSTQEELFCNGCVLNALIDAGEGGSAILEGDNTDDAVLIGCSFRGCLVDGAVVIAI